MRRPYRVGALVLISRLSFAFGVLFATWMILAFAFGQDAGEPVPSIFYRVGGIGLVLATTIPYLAFTWRFMMYGVFVGAQSVIVRRMWNSTRLAWNEIDSFETVSAFDAQEESFSWRLTLSSGRFQQLTLVRIRLASGAICDVTELNSSVPTWMGDRPIAIVDRLETARRTTSAD